MPSINIKAAGDVPPKVDKYVSESIVYLLNCIDILDKDEIIVSIVSPISQENISISDIRTRRGKSIELRIENSPTVSSNYVDYRITLLFNTNLGSKKAANFTVRAHK